MTFKTRMGQETITVDNCETYESAAAQLAKARYGSKATIGRTTGEHSKSGYFQAYLPKNDGLHAIGHEFHVVEIDVTPREQL